MPPPTTSTERNSSIELFRIIATFTVLIVHFNGWFVGGLPERLDFHHFDWHWVQFLISAATCVCVNLFVIISGYFGVKFKMSAFVHIGLILLAIFVPLYIVGALVDGSFSLKGLLSQLFFVTRAGYFVQCYLMLIFLSPLINKFIESNTRKNVLIWVLLLWIIEVWFGCVKDVKAFAFMNGYSIIHFVLIYMIARCIRLYESELKTVKRAFWLFGYLICTAVIWLMRGHGVDWGYANPVNVVSSVCLFMPFLYYGFSSRKINWVAKSTFSVYIIQVAFPVLGILMAIDRQLLDSLPYPMYLVSAFIVIFLFFMACVVYDKIMMIIIMQVEKVISSTIGINYNRSLFT